jgi:Zn-dependent protease with chaperone function
MNFFEHQEKARKKTASLVFYFILAIILIILSIDILAIGLIAYSKQEYYYPLTNMGYQLNKEALIQLATTTTLIVSPVIIATILLGTFLKLAALSNGGISVAEMVGATPIDPATNNFLEKRFINVVEEMSIASGISIPRLYVMENEPAINAFVAGINPDDTVMVVTKGALNQLSREELQGVVGHEFSHIFNSDMHVSLRLMGILGGLLLIGQLGFFLLRFVGIGNPRSRSDDRSDGRIIVAIMALGIGLLVIGYIGLFFGRLIKAGVSRQRELLADASSVQYTRNPQGIIFALKRIKQSESGSKLATKNVEDISHICFCPPRWVMFSNLLATHPPLADRIKILDPDNQYPDPPKLSSQVEPIAQKKQVQAPIMGAMVGAAVLASQVKQSIGNPTDDHVTLAQQLIAAIPEELLQLAHDTDKVELLYYALLLTSDPANTIATIISTEAAQQVNQYAKIIATLPASVQLPLIDISLPTFKSLAIDKRQQIMQNMKQLVAQSKENLFQFMLITLVEKAAQDKTKVSNQGKYQDFTPVMNEISTLIAHLVATTKEDPQHQESLFAKIMKEFTSQPISFSSINITEHLQLPAILAKLNMLNPLCKQTLIHACIECIEDDKQINLVEAELVRAIAASLDCPIPPIVPT